MWHQLCASTVPGSSSGNQGTLADPTGTQTHIDRHQGQQEHIASEWTIMCYAGVKYVDHNYCKLWQIHFSMIHYKIVYFKSNSKYRISNLQFYLLYFDMTTQKKGKHIWSLYIVCTDTNKDFFKQICVFGFCFKFFKIKLLFHVLEKNPFFAHRFLALSHNTIQSEIFWNGFLCVRFVFEYSWYKCITV